MNGVVMGRSRPSSFGRTIQGERVRSYAPLSAKKTQDEEVRFDIEFLRAARQAADDGTGVDAFAQTYDGPVLVPEKQASE